MRGIPLLMGVAVLSAVALPGCGSDGDHTAAPTATVAPSTTPGGPTPTATPTNPLARQCLASGGTVATRVCCASTSDFTNLCGIGACGCSPSASHEIEVCECAAGHCFDGQHCVSH